MRLGRLAYEPAAATLAKARSALAGAETTPDHPSTATPTGTATTRPPSHMRDDASSCETETTSRDERHHKRRTPPAGTSLAQGNDIHWPAKGVGNNVLSPKISQFSISEAVLLKGKRHDG